MERINSYYYSSGKNRKSRFICYYKKSIREEVVKEPKRCCATISLKQKLKEIVGLIYARTPMGE